MANRKSTSSISASISSWTEGAMVRIDRVVTRGGDGGATSLGDGERVAKDAPRIEAVGAVDEANAAIGVVRLHTEGDADADAMLARIQNDLFDLGADLCVPGTGGDRLRLTAAAAARLEAEVAAMNVALPGLTSFILPGGTPSAAFAHLARTIARRAERRVVSLTHLEPVNPELVRYLNRLSDHLFVLGRRFNAQGTGDVLWVPGANR
jgi:cob(I)alamin adenosyltransferase